MKFANASRFAGDHDVVLVGYRGVDGSSGSTAPRSPRRCEHSRDFLSAAGLRAVRRRVPGAAPKRLQRRRRRPRRLHAARARRRSRGRAARARLRPRRPAQRERRHPHGDDLRLALPEQHPPLGDDRRQPARALPLGRARRPTSRSGSYAALCAKDATCREPHARPRRLDARGSSQHIPATAGSCRSRRATSQVAAFFGLMDATADGGGADLGADDDRHAGSRPRNGDASGVWLLSLMAELAFPRARSGATSPPPAGATPPTHGASSRGTPTAARSSAAPAPISSGPAAGWSTPGRRARTTTGTRACRTRTSRRC